MQTIIKFKIYRNKKKIMLLLSYKTFISYISIYYKIEAI